jgi:hypothetical protein
MNERVTPLTRRPDPTPPSRRWWTLWAAALLVAGGVAFGYLVAPSTTSASEDLADPSADEGLPPPTQPVAAALAEPPSAPAVTFSGTLLASEAFGRSLVAWPGDGDRTTIRLPADATGSAYNAARDRVAVTFREFAGDGMSLHVGNLGDLGLVASGVTGFAWHPTNPEALAWLEETDRGFDLVAAVVSDAETSTTSIATYPTTARLVAWGPWGFALQTEDALTTVDRSGAVVASADLQLVAGGPDGRLLVARPAGTPLSSDWAITGPDLSEPLVLDRFGDLDEHATAAAILPGSGRIILVSNRFGDSDARARIEILAPDGTTETVIRSGMIAESIAWSTDESRLAIGGYYYGSNEVRSVVLLTATDGSGDEIEVPFDHQVRPLAIRS